MTAIEAVTTTGETSALCHSVGLSRASFYRRWPTVPVAPATPRPMRAPSPRALVPVERQAILDTLHSERFLDQSPAEVHATLLEEAQYLGADYFDRMNSTKAKRYHLRRLEELGCDVSKVTAA